MCSFDARNEGQPSYSLRGQEAGGTYVGRLTAWWTGDPRLILLGGPGQKIEQVLDVQVDSLTTRMVRSLCYAARPPAADLNS